MSEPVKEIYGIGAQFGSPGELYQAVEKVRDRGFRWWDAYSPFPIHGLDKAMGLKKSWVSAVVLFAGFCAASGAFSLELLTSMPRPGFLHNIASGYYLNLFYPITVSGKPYFSLPAFFPVVFQLTVMISSFGAGLGILLFTLKPRLHHPIFNWDAYCDQVSDDGFFIVIEASDPLFGEVETTQLLRELGGQNITVISK